MKCHDDLPAYKPRGTPNRAGANTATSMPRPKNQRRIDVLHTLRLGGIDQAIHICGENFNLPLLVFLHGGPGLPHMPFAHVNAELTRSFLVVNWDQRGAGKSYSPFLQPQDMSIEQLVADACELLTWLHRHFTPPALVLVGHSWGSAFGTLVAARSPHLVSAYVGIGQVTNLRRAEESRYQFCSAIARQRHDLSAANALRRLGAPPYADSQKSDLLERLAFRLASKFY